MRILGINALNHDAAVCVIEDGEILFGAHSERYSGKKFDSELNEVMVLSALSYGMPDKVAWFEKPYLKKTRQLWAGQYGEVFNTSNIPSQYLKGFVRLENNQMLVIMDIETVVHKDELKS